MRCPLCNGTLEEMKKSLYWKCDMCAVRMVAEPDEDSALALWRSEQAYKYMMLAKKSGGSKTGGNRMKRKKVAKKPAYFLE